MLDAQRLWCEQRVSVTIMCDDNKIKEKTVEGTARYKVLFSSLLPPLCGSNKPQAFHGFQASRSNTWKRVMGKEQGINDDE